MCPGSGSRSEGRAWTGAWRVSLPSPPGPAFQFPGAQTWLLTGATACMR